MRKWTWFSTTEPIPWAKTEADYEEMNKKVWLNNIDVPQKPRLIVDFICHEHIKNLHKEYPHTEWLAICKVVQQWDWVFKIVDMIHPEQRQLPSDVETTDKGMDWCVDYLLEKWEDLWNWNCVLHSHHTMWCFWSSTDNKARLWLNDWRTLAWAVVTAYKEWTDWELDIDYKWCINFYKPYNIEIDADMFYEDFFSEEEQAKITNYNEAVKTKIKEIQERKFEEQIEEFKRLWEYPDYSRLLDYLGIDITEELLANYKEVAKKIPNPQVEEAFAKLENEAREEALQEVPQEEIQPLLQQIEDFREWSTMLIEQLKEHRVATSSFERVYTWWTQSLPTKARQKPLDNYYSKALFPTEISIRSACQLPSFVKIRLDDNWWRLVFCPVHNRWEYVSEYIDETIDDNDVFIP